MSGLPPKARPARQGRAPALAGPRFDPELIISVAPERACAAPLLSRRAQPALVEYLFCAGTVDMRADQLFVRIGDLLVFVFAVLGPVLRHISLLDHVAEQL